MSGDEPKKPIYTFNKKPRDFVDFLDKRVVGQYQAKIAIASSFCRHYKEMSRKFEVGYEGYIEPTDEQKPNLLLIGPTGSGKTRLIRLASHYVRAPCAEVDATAYTVAGYVGEDLEDIGPLLVEGCQGELDLAQIGVIWVDEFDKLAVGVGSDGRDVHRGGVQDAFLKIVEGRDLPAGRGRDYPITINTKDVLFVFTGAFEGLDKIIRTRRKKSGLGFGANPEESMELLRSDLKEYGMSKQLLGRLGVHAELTRLTEEELYKILNIQNGEFVGTQVRDFQNYDIELDFSDESLHKIAAMAHASDEGARSLNQIIYSTTAPLYFKLPSTNIDQVTITPEAVEDPEGFLERLLKQTHVTLEEPSMSQEKEDYFHRLGADDLLQDFKRLRINERLYRSGISFAQRNNVEGIYVRDAIKSIEKQMVQFCRRFKSKNKVSLVLDDEVKGAITQEVLSTGSDDAERILDLRLGRHLDDPSVVSQLKKRGKLILTQADLDDMESFLQEHFN